MRPRSTPASTVARPVGRSSPALGRSRPTCGSRLPRKEQQQGTQHQGRAQRLDRGPRLPVGRGEPDRVEHAADHGSHPPEPPREQGDEHRVGGAQRHEGDPGDGVAGGVRGEPSQQGERRQRQHDPWRVRAARSRRTGPARRPAPPPRCSSTPSSYTPRPSRPPPRSTGSSRARKARTASATYGATRVGRPPRGRSPAGRQESSAASWRRGYARMLCPGCRARTLCQAAVPPVSDPAPPPGTTRAPADRAHPGRFRRTPARALLDWRLLRRGSPVARPRIATLTMNPALDLSTAADRVLPEHKLRCEDPRYHPGGGGINVARAVVRLGGDAVAVYPAGGPPGDLIDLLMEQEQVPATSWASRARPARASPCGSSPPARTSGSSCPVRRCPPQPRRSAWLPWPRSTPTRSSSWSAAACHRAPRPTCWSRSRPGAAAAAPASSSTCPAHHCDACAGQR